MNNQQMAKVLFSNKLATQEQIHEYWKKIDANHNIGELLRDAGILAPAMYEKVYAHIMGSVSAPQKTAETPKATPAAASAPQVPAKKAAEEATEIVIEGNNLYSGSSYTADVQVENISGFESTNLFAFGSAAEEENPDESASALPRRFAMPNPGEERELAAPDTVTVQTPLNLMIAFAKKYMATDIYLKNGYQIVIRAAGVLHRVSEAVIHPSQLSAWLLDAASGFIDGYKPAVGKDFSKAFSLPGVGRARLSVTWNKEVADLAIRLISNQAIHFKELGLPEVADELFGFDSGLILVSGPSGSGRSTTLAAIGEALAENRSIFLQSIEKPIERILKNPAGMVIQKEVELHTPSGVQGIYEALKNGANVLLFDSLETPEELFALVNAASAGMLVIAVTTGNYVSALLSKWEASVSESQKAALKNLLAEQLRGVIVQHLVPVADGQGQILAAEVLKVNTAVSLLIRQGDFMQVSSMIAANPGIGCSLDDSLQNWLDSGYIEGVEAWQRAWDTKRFAAYRPEAKRGI